MMQRTSNLKKPGARMGIRKRILIFFVVVCMISLVSISSLTSAFFNIINVTSKQQSATALKEQIQRNMGKSAVENAAIIDNKLITGATKVDLLAAHAKSLFDYPGLYDDADSYYHDLTASPQPPTPPGYYYDSEKYGQFISKDVSCYYLASGTYVINYTGINATMNETIGTSVHLDSLFQDVMQTHPDFHWIYMGFEIGMHRSYPWHKISNPSYDPRQRTWYQTATADDGNIVYTNPYYDASGGGLMISIAKTVRTSTNNLVGVVSADLTIETIRERILNVQLSPSGYAFLMNTNQKVIAHPNSSTPDVDINILEPSIPSSILDDMSALHLGFGDYNVNGKRYYISYAPVLSTGFSLAVIVPEEEVISVVDDLSISINSATTSVLVQTYSIIAVAAILAIFFGLLVSGKIIIPIKKLIEFSSRISTDKVHNRSIRSRDFKIDEKLENQDDEIGDLTRAFKNMIVSLQKEKDNG
ncbi:MAG: cache domain-containing protein [Candidatus Hodarchaeota archaeon]